MQSVVQRLMVLEEQKRPQRPHRSRSCPLIVLLVFPLVALVAPPAWPQEACEATLEVGNGSGAPASSGNAVSVQLMSNVPVRGIQMTLNDSPDKLRATGCRSLVSNLSCSFNDTSSGVIVIFLSLSGDSLPASDTPVDVLEILYEVTATQAPVPEIVTLEPMNISISDESLNTCPSVVVMSGSFLVSCLVDANGVRASRNAATGFTELRWNPVPGSSHHNTYRGSLPPDQLSAPYNHACYESDDAFSDGSTASTESTIPGRGTTFYYLINGENSCGEGTLGKATSGLLRPILSPCPTPP